MNTKVKELLKTKIWLTEEELKVSQSTEETMLLNTKLARLNKLLKKYKKAELKPKAKEKIKAIIKKAKEKIKNLTSKDYLHMGGIILTLGTAGVIARDYIYGVLTFALLILGLYVLFYAIYKAVEEQKLPNKLKNK